MIQFLSYPPKSTCLFLNPCLCHFLVTAVGSHIWPLSKLLFLTFSFVCNPFHRLSLFLTLTLCLCLLTRRVAESRVRGKKGKEPLHKGRMGLWVFLFPGLWLSIDIQFEESSKDHQVQCWPTSCLWNVHKHVPQSSCDSCRSPLLCPPPKKTNWYSVFVSEYEGLRWLNPGHFATNFSETLSLNFLEV